MSKTHNDMRKDYSVAVFFSNTITTELEMDEYLRKEFLLDFSFEIYAPAGPESSQGQSQPIELLLTGFSQVATFKDKAVALAKEKGITSATAAVVFYGFEYDASLINEARSHKLEFIGNIPLK